MEHLTAVWTDRFDRLDAHLAAMKKQLAIPPEPVPADQTTPDPTTTDPTTTDDREEPGTS